MEGLWHDVWALIWLVLVAVAIAAYLIGIVTVFADLFRDRELSGWWKAVWILFLVFVPLLTMLVYVIARGSGMVDRLQARRDLPPAESYDPPPPMANPASEIARAKELADQGIITAGEFDALKNKALGNRY